MAKIELQKITVSKEYIEKYNIEAFIKAAEQYKTAGIRGTIGETLEEGIINIGSIHLYAQARSIYIKNNYRIKKQMIYVGWDERRFSCRFAFELARVYIGNGIKVYYGPQSTPCPITSYTGWYYGIPADLITASHNKATKKIYYNGIKPSSDSGGLISETEINEIIENMKIICESKRTIYLVTHESSLIKERKPLPAYIQHIKNSLAKDDLASIRQAGESGVIKSCWGTYGGAAGPSLEKINQKLLGKKWDFYIKKLHWEPDPYFHGYGEKPDPSDASAAKEMLQREGVWEDMINGEISFFQATDGDGDRIGLFCKCPNELILKAKKAGLMIFNQEGNPYDEKNYRKAKPAIAYVSPYQIFIILTVKRLKKLDASGYNLRQFAIITSHSTPYFEKICHLFGCKLIVVPVGFRWLNLASTQIEMGSEEVEIEEVHWRGEKEIVRYNVGKVDGIVAICEESGGINFGNIKDEVNIIGRKSKIAKEKDAIKAFFFIQAEASKLALEGKNMIGEYLDISAHQGLGNSHFNRVDLSLTSNSGPSIKDSLMDFYSELCEKYKDHPRNIQVEGLKSKKIFKAGDGIKIIFETGAWLYLRPSGTEPKLKIFTWARDKKEREAIEKSVLFQKDRIISN